VKPPPNIISLRASHSNTNVTTKPLYISLPTPSASLEARRDLRYPRPFARPVIRASSSVVMIPVAWIPYDGPPKPAPTNDCPGLAKRKAPQPPCLSIPERQQALARIPETKAEIQRSLGVDYKTFVRLDRDLDATLKRFRHAYRISSGCDDIAAWADAVIPNIAQILIRSNLRYFPSPPDDGSTSWLWPEQCVQSWCRIIMQAAEATEHIPDTRAEIQRDLNIDDGTFARLENGLRHSLRRFRLEVTVGITRVLHRDLIRIIAQQCIGANPQIFSVFDVSWARACVESWCRLIHRDGRSQAGPPPHTPWR
jgi:hypothetical protein